MQIASFQGLRVTFLRSLLLHLGCYRRVKTLRETLARALFLCSAFALGIARSYLLNADKSAIPFCQQQQTLLGILDSLVSVVCK